MMTMLENLKPSATLIRLVGLLDQVPDKNFRQYCQRFETGGYRREVGPVKEDSKKILKDTLYPDFRNIMFSDTQDQHHVRYVTDVRKSVAIKDFDTNSTDTYAITVVQSELYLFRGHIGLFSLKIEIPDGLTLTKIRNHLFNIRLFDVICTNGQAWHDWISKNYLTGISMRSSDKDIVEADEYSGSKFKLFTAIQLDPTDANQITVQDRQNLLYDLGTVSHIGSAQGGKYFSPDPAYYDTVMENRVAAYQNWEAICLFDSFTCIGTKYLLDKNGSVSPSWDQTYFRIYLFRLFFKYNLYRYNSLVAESDSDKLVKHRDQFEEFLNQYNISHISFNFLPNLIFEKTGSALDLRAEVEMFRNRIKNISSAIQEKKQAKTNFLLQLVTGLSGLSVLSDFPCIVDQVMKFTHWTKTELSVYLFLLLAILGFGVFYYLKPGQVKKWFARK
jgi:hypothetical protein